MTLLLLGMIDLCPRDFFTQPYQPLDNKLYEKCSIDGWLEDIFFGEEDNFWRVNTH